MSESKLNSFADLIKIIALSHFINYTISLAKSSICRATVCRIGSLRKISLKKKIIWLHEKYYKVRFSKSSTVDEIIFESHLGHEIWRLVIIWSCACSFGIKNEVSTFCCANLVFGAFSMQHWRSIDRKIRLEELGVWLAFWSKYYGCKKSRT